MKSFIFIADIFQNSSISTPWHKTMNRMAFVHGAEDGTSVVFFNVAVTTEQIRECIGKLAHLGFKPEDLRWWVAETVDDWWELKKPVTDALGIAPFHIYTVVEILSNLVDPERLEEIMVAVQSLPGTHWKGYSSLMTLWGCTYGAVYFEDTKRRVRI